MKTKDLKIEYIEELADIVMNEVDVNDDDEKSISIIGKYEEIKEVLKAIIAGYEVDIMGLELPHPEWNGYDKEYDLSVWSCDGEITINCEAIQRDGEYLNLEGDILYIFDNCSSKILQKADYNKAYSVSVVEYDCDEDCDCECPCDCHKKEKEITPTSSYTINGKPVSKQEFDKKYAKIVNSYRENMRSTLLDYCSWMDEVNDILSRLW